MAPYSQFVNQETIIQRPENEKILCLNIDGGGVRGVFAAEFLACLEDGLHGTLYDTFDMYAGTSTGSFIALCIAANRFRGKEIVKWYEPEPSSIIFSLSRLKNFIKRKSPGSLMLFPRSRYTGRGKTNFCKKIFGDTKFHEIAKPTLVTAYDFLHNRTAIFKSTGGTEVKAQPYAYEVADASSAAPTFFPPVKVGEHWLVDGGLSAKNASLCQISHAFSLGYRLKQIYMLSVGTGLPPNHRAANKKYYTRKTFDWNGIRWLTEGLLECFMDGNTSTTTYLTSDLLRNRICRINPVIKYANYQMDDNSPKNIHNLKRLAKEVYMASKEEIFDLIKRAKEE